MKITLTDKQVVLVGWDRKKPYSIGRMCRSYILNPDEIQELWDVAETLSFGTDGPTASSAKGLLKKLDKLKEKE